MPVLWPKTSSKQGEFSTPLCHSDTAYVPTRHIDAHGRKARPARDSAHEARARGWAGVVATTGRFYSRLKARRLSSRIFSLWEISGRLRDRGRAIQGCWVVIRISDADRHRGLRDSSHRIPHWRGHRSY